MDVYNRHEREPAYLRRQAERIRVNEDVPTPRIRGDEAL